MKLSDFVQILAKQLSEPLAKKGFKRVADDLWVRFRNGHDINVISVQKHSSSSNVCVNIGVHYDFLPKVGTLDLPREGSIELADCEIKFRLAPDKGQRDHWWSIEPNSAVEISDLIFARTDDIFDQYEIAGDSSSHDITAIVPEDLDGEIPAVVSSLTKVRASLLLARLHEFRGDLEKAAGFANYGLRVAGMAVGPKKMLKEVLKRIEAKG